MRDVNRRALFGAAPALTVLAVPAAARAFQAGDTELIVLGNQHTRAVSAYEAAREACGAAYKRHEDTRPEAPVCLTITRHDCWDHGGYLYRRDGSLANERDVEYLRKWLASPHLRRGDFSRTEARAIEVIAAFEKHDRAVLMNEEKSGLVRAGEVEDDAYERMCDLEDRIVEAPCSTLAGLMVKARVAKRLVPDGDHVSNDWHDTAALAVIDVILKMGADS